MGPFGVQVSYESLPAPPELHDPEQDTLLGSLKRFFVPSAPPHHQQPGPTSTASTSNASTPHRESSPARPVAANHARKDALQLPSAHQQLSFLASAVRATGQTARSPPPPVERRPDDEGGSPDPNASGITLPNGQKYTRRLRLSGVTPVVGVTAQNSDRGALTTSLTSRNLAGGAEAGWQAAPATTTTAAGGGGVSGSPTTSEAFGGLTLRNLSSIPGFPLRGEPGEDSKSAWSVSTSTHASPTVVQIFRRLQGEVSALSFPFALSLAHSIRHDRHGSRNQGLSQEYWMKDESSKACYDCETVFTVFRRKHHCKSTAHAPPRA